MIERFISKINKTDDCWWWTAATDGDGYGKFSWGPKSWRLAHRVAYELWVGPLEPGKVIMHMCDHPLCVNPAHLRQGTHTENMRDAIAKGRKYVGEKNPNAKLTDKQVQYIRELYKMKMFSQRVLADMFNVSRWQITNIVHNKQRLTPAVEGVIKLRDSGNKVSTGKLDAVSVETGE